MEFPIAFALMVHDQITLFETLLASLFRPHNAYCVFMDGKANPGFKAQIHLLINCYKSQFPNVSYQACKPAQKTSFRVASIEFHSKSASKNNFF